ncbi:GNAT family N-acetyltransferase [Hoyosella rhizosphaerae]|uniref:N-acetyltransferase domain-containing protein n=1 Tax=Hoyosella rhizosphaerae TaxID=1755582 RepID=A0A916U0Q7_9ACTN|nr:GNAT family N-acetyltransferase [Hoyosella rhizosphaerae]MBN4926978.1 GNAT family N-acetyltransferase [Hoyosella rhizosphaerae]GGC54986.1 hypothetical protein GCM10011410_04240 [Hoyosella rhizosphaerae]
MHTIREIHGDTQVGATALLHLRPQWHNKDELANFIDVDLRPRGYRLVGGFTDGVPSAVAVAGFRENWSTAWGHHLYIDDLSTSPAERGKGHADKLLTWVKEEAIRLGCGAIHLDSGVGEERAAAHRLYMRHQFRIASHHFTLPLNTQ